jgi:2-polyprenyl-3-methyl-5-hydroxy-6-metoxy-1,4-benzoquinol methylase
VENAVSLKYDFPVDMGRRNSVYSRIIGWSTPGSRVLDVGCDTGNLGAAIKRIGAWVEGLEIDPAAAGRAVEKLDRVYTGNIEDEELLARLDGPYDCVIFADVLEHIAAPERALEKVKRLLKRDTGVVVASLPNVANFRVRIGLLFGRFEYTEIGILDRTHLRFFTKKTARELFTGAGFNVLDVKPAATYIPGALLRLWPEFFATRFVIKAGLGKRA